MTLMMNWHMRYSLVAAGAVCALLSARPGGADVTYTEDVISWWTDTSIVHSFPFLPAHVAAANEVPKPPKDGTNLGTDILTFEAVNTGLPVDFSLEMVHGAPEYEFWYNHPAFTELYYYHLAAGEPDASPDSDWRITFTGGEPVYAFSFDLIGNGEGKEETLTVYGEGDALLGTFPVSGGSVVFVGVTSSEPITRIEFNSEVDLGDDFALGGFRFSTQPPVCRADIDGDGTVGASDLLALLANWGVCP